VKTEPARVLLGGSCPAGWHYYNVTDSCFYTSTTQVDQPTARDECKKMAAGADLASVSDQDEMSFVALIS